MSKFKTSNYSDTELAKLDAETAQLIRNLKSQTQGFSDAYYDAAEVFRNNDADLYAMAEKSLKAAAPKAAPKPTKPAASKRVKVKTPAPAPVAKAAAPKAKVVISNVDEWEDNLTDIISSNMNVSRGDAQGMLEAQSFYMSQAWGRGLSEKEAYKYIAEKAGWPKAKVVKLKKENKPSSQSKINDLRKQREAKLEQSTRTDKLRNMSREEVLAAAREFNSLRSLHAQVVDGGGIHKKMLDPTPENLVRWMRNPGKFDIRGIDAPRAAEATANLKKPDSFWKRLGF